MSEISNSRLLGKITILVMVGLCVNTALALLDGSGTQEDPWRIGSLVNFYEFATDKNYWDDYTRLEADVNLAGMTYTTCVIASPFTTAFTGIFDGNDHKITNLTINGGANDYLGLFGYISGGQVRNLGIEKVSISGDELVGGLVGFNDGNVSYCYSIGFVNGRNLVGGLLGFNDGSVSNSCSAGNVSGSVGAGGLLGANRGSVLSCYSTADVTGDISNKNFGGLVGENLGIVSNCYSTGFVSGGADVGGLLGDNEEDGNVSNCYSTGDVSGYADVGGLVGDNAFGSLSNCFWDTDNQTHDVVESIGNERGGTVINVAGLPTAQMQIRSTFTDADWDFINVWNIGENQTYPYLRAYLPSDINKDGIVNFLDFAITANKWLEDARIE